MKSLIIKLISLVLVITMFTGCGNGNKKDKPKKAPNFTLEDLNGNEVSLDSLKGNKVYLNIFATWCTPCVSELPDINSVYKEMKDEDTKIYVINLGEEENKVKNFIEKNKFSFPVLLDPTKSLQEPYNINGIPVSLFIDKNGYIVSHDVGVLSKAAIIDKLNSY